jgi:hypothetical protein
MKKFIITSAFLSIGFWMNAQTQINMIWCGIKEAGNSESIVLTPECMSEVPRFWNPEMGEFKCLGFKMALVQNDVSTVFTSFDGELTEGMRASFKSNGTVGFIQFYDVIVMSSSGETILSDKVYKVRYKLSK